jgi:sensor histidine kinase YesM
MLQAQIEPHFLFNTLANVVSLVDVDQARAKQMLEYFSAYLRSSLAISRQEQSTMAREEELLRNYLSLLKIRMAERLTYSIEVETALASHPIAPMLLQPLVENAIKHGLEPKIEGGHISVRVWRDGTRVKAEVLDNGLGFGAMTSMAQGSGVGLSNLRERLAVLYDGNAQLTIVDAQPGTRVLIDMPDQGEN